MDFHVKWTNFCVCFSSNQNQILIVYKFVFLLSFFHLDHIAQGTFWANTDAFGISIFTIFFFVNMENVILSSLISCSFLYFFCLITRIVHFSEYQLQHMFLQLSCLDRLINPRNLCIMGTNLLFKDIRCDGRDLTQSVWSCAFHFYGSSSGLRPAVFAGPLCKLCKSKKKKLLKWFYFASLPVWTTCALFWLFWSFTFGLTICETWYLLFI